MFTDTYLPTVDGVVNSILNFRRELELRGHEVYIVAPGSKGSCDPKTSSPCDPKTFYCKSIPFPPYPEYKLGIPLGVTSWVRERNIDIVHSHGPGGVGLGALWVSRRLNIPLVLTFHTLLPDFAFYLTKRPALRKALNRYTWRYLRWYLGRSRCALVPSNLIKEELIAHSPDTRLWVVPNGVDIDRFNPGVDGSSIREKHGLEGARVVVQLGRLAREKRLEMLIEAAGRLDCKFLIVGDGPARDYYKSLAMKEGVGRKFIFTGFVSGSDLPSYYACADAFVIPSKVEVLPTVVLEAMASGKPVAGANSRGIPELVHDGENGYLFNPDSPKECASAIEKALNCGDPVREPEFP